MCGPSGGADPRRVLPGSAPISLDTCSRQARRRALGLDHACSHWRQGEHLDRLQLCFGASAARAGEDRGPTRAAAHTHALRSKATWKFMLASNFTMRRAATGLRSRAARDTVFHVRSRPAPVFVFMLASLAAHLAGMRAALGGKLPYAFRARVAVHDRCSRRRSSQLVTPPPSHPILRERAERRTSPFQRGREAPDPKPATPKPRCRPPKPAKPKPPRAP